MLGSALELTANDTVIEIGPGIGFLTRILCQSQAEVIAVELDRESVDYLKGLKLAGLTIKHGDFLAYDILSGRFRQDKSTGWSEPSRQERFKIVGNVPYQITGLILGHLLGEVAEPAEHLHLVDSLVLTVQKEVAERMVALPASKHYARLSLLIAYFCRAEIIAYLPAESFYPVPRVDSAIVKMVPLAEPPVKCSDPRFFRQVIKAGFAQRRKMLRNGLTSMGLSQEDLNRVFQELRFDPQVRAETLSLPQFAMLTDALCQLRK